MKNQFSPQLWDKIWEWPGDKASWWLEPSLFVPDFVLQGWVLSAFWTVYKQTVCTRLPCSLQTQEPGIKANIYAVIYIMHADTVKKNSITWVVEIQPNSYINIHTTPIQHFWQGDGKCLYKILSDSHSSIVWQRRFYKLQKKPRTAHMQAYQGPSYGDEKITNVFNQTFMIIHATSTQALLPQEESWNSFSIYVYTWWTRVGHNLYNSHELLLSFMWLLMHWHTCNLYWIP